MCVSCSLSFVRYTPCWWNKRFWFFYLHEEVLRSVVFVCLFLGLLIGWLVRSLKSGHRTLAALTAGPSVQPLSTPWANQGHVSLCALHWLGPGGDCAFSRLSLVYVFAAFFMSIYLYISVFLCFCKSKVSGCILMRFSRNNAHVLGTN